jgi:magnesium chelatase subunit I
MNELLKIKTLGELKASGYTSRSIGSELRENLIDAIRNNRNPFPGILGYEKTVMPDIQRAILSGHNINLLGLRGQAKTRIARQMTALLDEYIPVLKGSEINEDPLNPITNAAKEQSEKHIKPRGKRARPKERGYDLSRMAQGEQGGRRQAIGSVF